MVMVALHGITVHDGDQLAACFLNPFSYLLVVVVPTTPEPSLMLAGAIGSAAVQIENRAT